MAEDRCVCCGDIIPEGRQVCPNCEKQKPMKNLSHGEMVQIAEGKKNKMPRYIDANKLIDLATHEGAYGYVDVHDIYNIPTADVVERKKGWIQCSERLPENTEPVNITWINRKPVSYYADIKDKPYTGTGIYCNGKWWWYSVTCQDYLDEYGKSPGDDMDEAIEVLAWMPLPEPYQSNIEEKTDAEIH